jgi:AhpD family alkylhydroperoxidase
MSHLLSPIRHEFSASLELNMTKRLDLFAAAADEMSAFVGYAKSADFGFEPSLTYLVMIRASQINGCAPCLHMHSQEALRLGESQERLTLLGGWRDAGLFTARERAALAWTEAVGQLSAVGISDGTFDALMAQFSEAEAVKLTLLINIINSFNRLNVAFRQSPAGVNTVKAAA